MKKIFTLTTLLSILLFSAISCGSDSNEPEEILPITEGVWKTHYRVLKTNYSDFDIRVNPYFVSALDTLTIEQVFDEPTKTTTITTKRQNGEVRSSAEYAWEIKTDLVTLIDSLYLLHPEKDSIIMRSAMQLSRKSLIVNYKADIDQIKPLLIELYIDPNILDSYPEIEGTYTTQSSR